jgi:apolipoprotein N-acyltransferase
MTSYPVLYILLSAALNIAIFPSLDLSGLAFVGFVPLFLLIPRYSSRKLLLFFGLAGFLFNLGNLYWIELVIKHYTALNFFLAVGLLLLLCLLLCLFWGAFGLALSVIARRSGLQFAFLLAPFLWIALEWIRLHTTDFPWCLLGYSQYKNLRIAQLATFTGVYGLSFLIMAVNAAIVTAFLLRKYYYLLCTLLFACLLVLYGNYRIARPVGDGSLKIGCIQGNIPQDVKINYEFADQINQKHLRMTRELIAVQKPDLVFWSEASVLFPLRAGGEWTNQILSLARSAHTPLIVGSDSFLNEEIYNSAFLIDSNGQIAGQYDKIYLVPFGEYVPLKWLFFFAGKVVPEISDFTAGKHYSLFAVKGHKIAIHICFEVVFPQLCRQFVLNGAGLLSTITNDAWFGKTSAPYQHFAMSVMRAIESRRYMVRTANTGISGFVDPYGRILQATGIYVPATITGEVNWIQELTFYSRYGDLLVYISLFVSILGFLIKLEKRKTDLVL